MGEVSEKARIVDRCPECGSLNLARDYERAELSCMNCGLVVCEKIEDPGPEWRAFDQEQLEKRTRVGAPMTLTIHDKGLSTVIDWRNRDGVGRTLSLKRRLDISRLRKWQQKVRVLNASERNLAFALSELDRMASQLNIPRNILESAALIYRKAIEEKLVKGRSIEAMAAATLYSACRWYKIPRTLDEILNVAQADRREVTRSYRFVVKELSFKVPPTSPIDYIPRIASKLDLDGEVQTKAVEVLQEASEHGLSSGRGPLGMAAAALYVACLLLNHRRTQRDIANIANITEVTIRNRYKELLEKLVFEIPV